MSILIDTIDCSDITEDMTCDGPACPEMHDGYQCERDLHHKGPHAAFVPGASGLDTRRRPPIRWASTVRISVKNPNRPITAEDAKRAGFVTLVDASGDLAVVCEATEDDERAARSSGLMVERVTTSHKSVPTFAEAVSTAWVAA